MADTKIREGASAPDSPSNIQGEGRGELQRPKDTPAELDRGKFTMDDVKRGYKPGG